MAYSFSRAQKFGAVFIMLAVVILIGASALMMQNQGWFKTRNTYYTEFSTAQGLNQNMRISLNGKVIGSLRDFDLNNENSIDAVVQIEAEYTNRVREDSVLVLSSALIGGSSLALYPGTAEAPALADESFLQSSDTERGALLVEVYRLTMGGDDISQLIDTLNALGESLADPRGNLQLALGNINRIAESIADAAETPESGNIGYILYDPAVRGEIQQILGSIQSNLMSIQQTLEQTDPLLQRTTETLENVRDITEGLSQNPMLGGEGRSRTNTDTRR